MSAITAEPAEPVEPAGGAEPATGAEPSADAPDEVPAAPLLVEPRDGTPAVLTRPADLAGALTRLVAGSGPLAVDAERASGYRYSQRAYLVQLRRSGAGTVLIDPLKLPDLGRLGAALASVEWVLHAAGQDLPCLVELGLRPDRIFDTELAARLAGYERVGLAALTERLLGVRLEKGHSAADWSTRPLPEPWLRYAALDVELLVDLRDRLESELIVQGKLEWALEEFAAQLTAVPTERPEPWRRTSGIHRVRTAREAATVRALWEARDALARARDVAPGRTLPDTAILAAALDPPANRAALARMPIFGGPRMRRHLDIWWRALDQARELPDERLPRVVAPTGGPPPTSRWGERDAAAAGRLVRVRAALHELSDRHQVPVENLCEPALVRRIAWRPPQPVDIGAVADALRDGGARPWQVRLVAEPLAAALDTTG